MEAEDLYLVNLGTIERIAAFICRRNHVNEDEAADFTSEVRLRLLENEYGIIRKFEGRSTFSTYLTTVITRLYHQYRIEQWGKWRPSAEAKRLGDKAITLERLMTRDGYSLAEAVSILTTRSGGLYSVAELESIYIRLPSRQPRPMLVSDDVSAEAAAAPNAADEPLLARDRARAIRVAAASIDRVIATLPPEDRLILQMRFWGTRKVPEIARALQLDQKKVYKRLDKLFAILRRALEGAGIGKADVDSLLSSGDQELRLELLSGEELEKTALGPSHLTGGNTENGEGRGLT